MNSVVRINSLQAFIECIQTGEFMHVYNAIIVMKEILPVFPLASTTDVGASLDTAMDRLLETEERGDLKILGRAYVILIFLNPLSHNTREVIPRPSKKGNRSGQFQKRY